MSDRNRQWTDPASVAEAIPPAKVATDWPSAAGILIRRTMVYGYAEAIRQEVEGEPTWNDPEWCSFVVREYSRLSRQGEMEMAEPPEQAKPETSHQHEVPTNPVEPRPATRSWYETGRDEDDSGEPPAPTADELQAKLDAAIAACGG